MRCYHAQICGFKVVVLRWLNCGLIMGLIWWVLVLVGFGYVCIGSVDFNGDFCLSGVSRRQLVIGFLSESGFLGFVSVGLGGLGLFLVGC